MRLLRRALFPLAKWLMGYGIHRQMGSWRPEFLFWTLKRERWDNYDD